MSSFVVRGQAGSAAVHDGSVPFVSLQRDGADTLISVDQGGGRVVETYRLSANRVSYVGAEEALQQFVRGTIGTASVSIASNVMRLLEEQRGETLFSRDTGATSTAITLMPVTVGGTAYVLAAGAEFSGVYCLTLSGRSLTVVGSTQDTSATFASGVTAMAATEMGGQMYIAVASGTQDGVTLFRMDSAGRMTATTSVGASTGVPIDTPQTLQMVTTSGGTFLLVGASGSGSITVFEVSPTGGLSQTDHILDDRDSRFAGITIMETVLVNGIPYVVVAGADDGLTLFTLLPDGSLVRLATIEDDAVIGLDNITAVALQVEGNTLHVFVTSQSQAGLAHLTVAIDPLTRVVTGGGASERLTGGNGQDFLLDGRGADTVEGGLGADIFVFAADGAVDTITDFQSGIDRIDLSSWGRLYSTAQLDIRSIPGGAEIVFNNERLIVLTHDGRSLSYQSFLDTDMLGIARIPLAPPEAHPGLPQTVTGTPLQDVLTGGDFNDTIMGLDEADSIQGGLGADVLRGDGGSDTLYGGDGDDRLQGGAGADSLLGDAGSDLIEGESAPDVLYGGAGTDTLIGGTGADTLFGGDGDDEIFGNTAVDLIYGGLGNDSISSGDGVDVVYGGGGQDTVIGRTGWDTLFGDDGDDVLFGSDGQDSLFGGVGADSLSGGYGWDFLFGGDGHDTLYGNIGADALDGGGGDDSLSGGTGDDTLVGGAGNDRLFGNQGVDRLDGGAGADELRGGTLADSFVFRAGSGDDVITDFEHWQDILQVERAMLFNLTPQQFLDRHAQVLGTDTLLTFANGDSVLLLGISDPDVLIDNFRYL